MMSPACGRVSSSMRNVQSTQRMLSSHCFVSFLTDQFKRPSFIVLSIGSVVALSAILMGMRGLLDIWSSHGMVEHGSSGICEAGL